jgi:hypothetical protein
MQRYDIVVPKKDPKNPEKTYWKNVGNLVRFDATQEKPEGFIIELHMFPDTTFKIFEQRAKDDGPKPEAPPEKPEINPDDIPF